MDPTIEEIERSQAEDGKSSASEDTTMQDSGQALTATSVPAQLMGEHIDVK